MADWPTLSNAKPAVAIFAGAGLFVWHAPAGNRHAYGPLTQRAARSYTALPRAAHYPLSLPPYCKAFMAFLGFWRSASLRSDIFLLNWSPA
jgi:hypothetical protein